MSALFTAASSEFAEGASAPVGAVPITIAGWFQIATLPSTLGVPFTIAGLFNNGSIGSRNCFYIGVDTANRFIAATADAVGLDSAIIAAPTLSVNTWYFGAGVFTDFDDRTAYIYSGGTLTSTNNAVSRTPAGINRIVVGRRSHSAPDRYLNGRVRNIGFWNTTLSLGEITALAKGFSPRLVRPQSLIGHYDFTGRAIGTSGTELAQRSGGVNLSYTGGALSTAEPRIYETKYQQQRKNSAGGGSPVVAPVQLSPWWRMQLTNG